MSRKNLKSTAEYLSDAKALSDRFPNLRKYRRRKTLKPQEKSAIQRVVNIIEILALPNKERPAHLQKFTFPADRKKKDSRYVREAAQLAEIGFDNFKKYKGRKKLKPAEKAAITRAKKKSRYLTDEVVKLPPKEAKKLKHKLRFPVPGLNAIKLKNIEIPTPENKIRRVIKAEPYGISVSIRYPSGLKRFYKFVYTGSDLDDMAAAAEELLNEGAKSVHVWLNHGMAGEGHTDAEDFVAMLGDESAIRSIMADTGDTPEEITSSGYIAAYDKQQEKSDKLKTQLAEVPWIWGVVGFFETSKRKKPHRDYSMR